VRAALATALVVLATAPGVAAKRRHHHHHAQQAAEPGAGSGAGSAAPAKKKHPHAWPLPAQGPTRSGDPELIFTFDDGPNPKTTPEVLDTLKKHHIHATFFLVGEMAAGTHGKELVAREQAEGHIIGNHTMHHHDECRLKSEEAAAADIDDGRAAIIAAGAMPPVWIRVPYGVRCERVDQLLEQRGLHHFHWDLDPQEWKKGTSPQKVLDYLEKHIGAMEGRQVLLMHDIKPITVEVLPQLLDWIDAENARRKTAHLRRIRIIQSYELAEEQLAPGLLDWLAAAAPSPAGLANAVARVLP
jgi:peptidoglycan/xylan/chitin deacetylase (PgdA/CDA1 family)